MAMFAYVARTFSSLVCVEDTGHIYGRVRTTLGCVYTHILMFEYFHVLKISELYSVQPVAIQ